MHNFWKTKCSIFYINILTLLLTLVGGVFFLMSYTTGYVSIVYGKDNSIGITMLSAVLLVLTLVSVIFQIRGKMQRKEVYDVIVYASAVILITAVLFLAADRVDAIGNCIIAPWDAGHGGEDSCYLSFVSMGCWLVAMILNLAGCFLGYRVRETE